MALAETAPELPAETKASALPSFTRRIATLMEQFFFRRTALAGDSSISATSGACTTSNVPAPSAVFALSSSPLGSFANSAAIC